MTKVAVLLADGFEPIEGLCVVDVLRRGGVDVTTVSVMGRRRIMAARDIPVEADALLDDYDFDAASWIVTPGGIPGTPNLRASARVCDLLRTFLAQKNVGSICAAPSILAELGLLDGRTATCAPGFDAAFPAGVRPAANGVYRDGNLVTASGMGWSLPFALELLRAMEGDDAVAKVCRGLAIEAPVSPASGR